MKNNYLFGPKDAIQLEKMLQRPPEERSSYECLKILRLLQQTSVNNVFKQNGYSDGELLDLGKKLFLEKYKKGQTIFKQAHPFLPRSSHKPCHFTL